MATCPPMSRIVDITPTAAGPPLTWATNSASKKLQASAARVATCTRRQCSPSRVTAQDALLRSGS
eukprot:4499027-Pyramimonas_sp.AAC.1